MNKRNLILIVLFHVVMFYVFFIKAGQSIIQKTENQSLYFLGMIVISTMPLLFIF